MGDKKYYWLRLKNDFFKRHDIKIISSMPNGRDIVLLYIKLMVESVDHEGYLRFSDAIPYTPEMISTVTETKPGIVNKALDTLMQFGLIEQLEDGTFFLTKVPEMIGTSTQDDHTRESTRLRVKAYRERHSNTDEALQDRYSNVTCNGEIEKEIEIDIDKEFSSDRLNKAFSDYLIYRKVSTDIEKEKIKDKLVKLANCDENLMIRILEQSMEQGWKGLYPLKQKDEKKKTRFSNFDERDYGKDQYDAIEKAMGGG